MKNSIDTSKFVILSIVCMIIGGVAGAVADQSLFGVAVFSFIFIVGISVLKSLNNQPKKEKGRDVA